jgi:hypothetical protein
MKGSGEVAMRWYGFLALLWLAAWPAMAADDLPIFDAHLHYNQEAREPYPVARVLALFRENNVRGILANSRPNDGSWALDAARGELWVVPFMRPYRTRADINTWFADPAILALVEAELARAPYQGIGEFHLHGADAKGPQVRRIVEIAVARDLWLHAHSDAAAVEALYAHDRRVKVIWAHTGFSAPVEEVERLLAAHPTLMAELSYRGGITAGGSLTPEWRRLFTSYPDRFLLGSDTWINERWASYGTLMRDYRAWLAQLPRDVAERIAYKNAERLFVAR